MMMPASKTGERRTGPVELRQMQYFLCLAEEKNVTRAARQLNIVQPALSMQIAKLEEELGRQLFVRGSKGMTPTEHATHMYALFLPVLLTDRKSVV